MKAKVKKSKRLSEPTIVDILVLGKFSDGKVRQITTKDKTIDCILDVIKFTSDRQIISVLDQELGIDFERPK